MPSIVQSNVSVNALIVFDDEVLLQRVVSKGNLIGIPGGKVEGEESFVQALQREVEEETGITPSQYVYEKIGIIHERPQVTVKHIFILHLKEKVTTFTFDAQEISECFWVKFQDIPMDSSEYRKEWVLEILQKYFGT